MYPFLYFIATIQTSSLISIFLSFDKINRYYNRKKKREKKTLQMKLASDGALVGHGARPPNVANIIPTLSLSPLFFLFRRPFVANLRSWGANAYIRIKRTFRRVGWGYEER